MAQGGLYTEITHRPRLHTGARAFTPPLYVFTAPLFLLQFRTCDNFALFSSVLSWGALYDLGCLGGRASVDLALLHTHVASSTPESDRIAPRKLQTQRGDALKTAIGLLRPI